MVDIQLRERITGIVEISGDATARPSIEGSFEESSLYSRHELRSNSETRKWKRYQTRVMSKAKGKLVAFEVVQSNFVGKLASFLAGVL